MRKTVLLISIALFILAGCATSGTSFESLPEGDATHGESIFTQSISGAPPCSTCHNLSDVRLVGPGFAGYSELAGTRVEGQSAAEYTYNAILSPSRYIVDGYTNLMYTEYGSKLSEQDTADLIAFLLTQ